MTYCINFKGGKRIKMKSSWTCDTQHSIKIRPKAHGVTLKMALGLTKQWEHSNFQGASLMVEFQ